MDRTTARFAGRLGRRMSNYTILLVDYEPKSIERTRLALKSAGYRVEVASDGLSGIEAFHRVRPDLVMIEAMIPKKHGFEVCQELKKTPLGKRTPIIVTTSVYKGRKYRNQACHLHGCDEYVEKPIDDQDLVTICRRLLRDKGDQPAPSMTSPSATETISDAMGDETAPAAGPFPDEDELEILARLDAILPGSQRLVKNEGPKGRPRFIDVDSAVETAPGHLSRSAGDSGPIDGEEEEDIFRTMVVSGDGAAAMRETLSEHSPTRVGTAAPNSPSATVTAVEDGIGTSRPTRHADERGREQELQVVSFEVRRSRKKDRRKKRTSAVPPAGRTVAAAVPALPDELTVPRTEAAPRFAPSPRRMPEPETRRQAAEIEPAVDTVFEEEPSSLWLWIAVSLLLIVAAGALVYLSLGTPLNT